ncbi:hypothetical protein Hdeb2414_s0018g00536731 [Helianthus debilis subsp. tardiflorus]
MKYEHRIGIGFRQRSKRERERQIRGGEGSEPSPPAGHPLGGDDGRMVLTRQTVERAAVDRERERGATVMEKPATSPTGHPWWWLMVTVTAVVSRILSTFWWIPKPKRPV